MPAALLNANAYCVNALCPANKTSPAATQMNLEIIIPSELIQTKTVIMWALHVEYENMIQMNLFAKYKWTHRHRKWTYGYQRGKVEGREDKLGVWDWHVCMLVTQSCPTLCDPMDCSLPDSAVHGILQTRMLKWVVIPFSRGSSWPRDQNQVSWIAGGFFTTWATREDLMYAYYCT